MKEFLKRLFAVIGVLATLIVIGVGFLVSHWIKSSSEADKAPEKIVLALDFTEPVTEPLQDFRFSIPKMLGSEGTGTSLIYILRALENAKNDPKVKGVMARFGSEATSLVHGQEIAAALDSFREKGKFTYVYAPSYGDFANSGGIYSLASHFENIWLQPVGTVGLSPIVMEAPFGKTALSKFGVETDFMRREDYKSVMENVSRDSFSAPVKANMQSMVDSLGTQMADMVASGRKIPADKAKALIANGPYTSTEALKNGLVTKLGYADEFEDEIEKLAGKDVEALRPSDYLYYLGRERKDKPKAKIALIYADGLISDTAPKGPQRMTESDVIDTQAIVDGFDAAAKDDEVKAILFRVNSPGGSPVASETIRRALLKAKEKKKPVFVSMGRVAASGGYWIAMNADKIIADPATITGSIGVVAGKFVAGGLFDKVGVKWDGVSNGNATNMWSMRTPFDAKGRERVNAMLDETYAAFTKNVAEARNIPPEKIGDIAKGRVFTGEQALTAGLVDELGGMNTAVDAIKKHVGLKPEDHVAFRQFPEPETPATLIMHILENIGFDISTFSDLYGLRKVMATVRPYLDTATNTSVIATKLPPYFLANGI